MRPFGTSFDQLVACSAFPLWIGLAKRIAETIANVNARPRVIGTVIEFWSLFIAAVAYRIIMSHVIDW